MADFGRMRTLRGRLSRSGARRRARLVGLVLAVVVGGACQPAAYTGAGPRVFVTGDSLVYESEPTLRAELQDRQRAVATRSFPGTRIGWSADQVAGQVGAGGAAAPDAIVVASGTNNVEGGWTAADRLELKAALGWAWPEGRCVVWILPATVRHYGPPGAKVSVVDAGAVTFVTGLRDALAPRPVRVADWGSLAAAHPEWYRADGVHHTPAGQAAYADFVAGAAVEHCP